MPVPSLEFHFDFGSPNAYLSHLLIPAIEARTGIRFEYVPVLLGGVFKATNNASPAVTMQGIKNKPAYQQIETRRFLVKHGINNFQHNPYFPVNTLKIMRGAVYAAHLGIFDQYVTEVYRHMWAEPKKMDEEDVIVAALAESGLSGSEIIAGTNNPGVKQQLIENTNRSVEMGAFGSPTFFVQGEIFFGKDRLRDVEEHIMMAIKQD